VFYEKYNKTTLRNYLSNLREVNCQVKADMFRLGFFSTGTSSANYTTSVQLSK